METSASFEARSAPAPYPTSLNVRTGELAYSNGAHNLPYCLRDGRIRLLSAATMLEAGDRLFPYTTLFRSWGKPAVRDFRGDDGNVGIIRSPVRAIVLLDLPASAV